jgi:hypothetical protein
MPGHDEEPDRLIADVVRQLRHPVRIDPALNDRVMAEIRRRPTPSTWRRAAWAGLALAAGLGGFALYLARQAREIVSGQGVAFSLEAPGASRVTLVGDFNNWDPSATPLARVNPEGRWEAIVPLDPGRYQFTFVVDDTRWVADPGRPKAVGDDFGQPTSVITVPNRGRS